MTAIDMILTAMAAGVSAGVSGTTSGAVQDAYANLKELVGRRLDGRVPEWEQAEPEVLRRHLADYGAESDQAVVDAAQKLLGLAGAVHHVSAPVIADRFDRSLNAPIFQGKVVFDYRTMTEPGQPLPPTAPAAL